VVAFEHGRPAFVMGFTVRGGKIVEIYVLADPRASTSLDLAVLKDDGTGELVMRLRVHPACVELLRRRGVMNFDQKMVDAIPTLAWCAQPGGGERAPERALARLYGSPGRGSLGWGWKTAIHPDDLAD